MPDKPESIKNYNPDVLSCLANLSNDEVFTPPKLANDVLDLLPESIWHDKNATFLDPCVKTGIFLREIVKRLNEGLKDEIPDLDERINHICTKQVFGIAITCLTSLLSRRSVYCSKTANGKYSICSDFTDDSGNIKFDFTKHTWKDGNCIFCGASQDVYDREEGLETYAYKFIHTEKPEDIFKMRFDVIVGNPPYQLSDGGNGKSAKPIYHYFIQQAKKLNPRYLTMIIPARWYAGGKGLDNFRKGMLNDSHISKLIDYSDSNECFPGVDIAGGICYFLWEKDWKGDCEIKNIHNGKIITSVRPLNEFDTFIRHSLAVPIVKKALALKEKTMNTEVSSRKPFGFPTNARPTNKGDILLKWNEGIGYIERKDVVIGTEMIDEWKVITSKVSYDHGGLPDKDGMRRVFSKIEILPPKTVCSETYIVVGSFKDKEIAENLEKYLYTKFVRFLVSQLSFSQDITKDRFSYVPTQDFSEEWTDEKLYEKYGLTEDEIAFIDSMIKPMEISNND